MKTTNFFYRISVGVICGSALALSACNDELTNTVDNEPVAANVTAQICTETRASGTSWTNNDAIGISSIGQTSACTNVKYVTANGDGILQELLSIFKMRNLQLPSVHTIHLAALRVLVQVF